MCINFEARLDDEDAHAFVEGSDSWAVQHIAEHAERLLNRTITLEQVASEYHPCVRRKDGHAPLLHTKVNTEGPTAHRCWDAEDAARADPREWLRTRLQLRFHVGHLWIMGAVVNTTDAQVLSEAVAASERACPF